MQEKGLFLSKAKTRNLNEKLRPGEHIHRLSQTRASRNDEALPYIVTNSVSYSTFECKSLALQEQYLGF